MRIPSSMRLGHITVPLATVVAGLFIHGMHANNLGLYWDDSDQFMQPLQWADGDIIRFVLSDTFGYLHAERPVAYFLTMVHRAAFAISLSALQWSMIFLLILDALMLEKIAAKIVNKKWYVFAVGVIFLTYPLAPLQSVNAMNLPHLWSCLLALQTILIAWYGLRGTEVVRLKWCALAAITYTASLLTHEAFALLPPAFVCLFVLARNGQPSAERYHFGRVHFYKPAIWWLSLFTGILGVYGLWRILILPMYGTFVYANSELVVSPTMVANKVLEGIGTVFFPWVPVAERVTVSPPPMTYIVLSAIVCVITWVITVRLLVRSSVSDYIDRKMAAKNPGANDWVRAAMIGTALVIASVVVIGVSSSAVDVEFGANALSPGPRVNFAATIGIALALPALFALLVQWCGRFVRLVQRYLGCASLFGLASLTFLIYVGFSGFPLYGNGNIFSHKSAVPMLFARYSLPYTLIIIAYLFVIVLITGMIVLSSVSYLRNALWYPLVHRIEPALPQIRAYCLSGVVASVVFFGTLFHFSIKRELVDEWRRHKIMLEQLHGIAPVLEDGTYIIIVHEQANRSFSMPYMTHSELSSYMLAIYDNWSITGNTDRNVRFYPDGLEARYYGKVATWLPPGVSGPVNLYATMPVTQISYDRILLFAFDGTTLRLLPEMEVEIEGKGRRVVKNNPERILNQAPVKTAIWRHVAEGVAS